MSTYPPDMNKFSLLVAYYTNISSSKRKFVIVFLVSLFISFPLVHFTIIFPHPQLIEFINLQRQSLVSFPFSISKNVKPTEWLEIIRGTQLDHHKTLNVGLINFKDKEQSGLVGGIVKSVIINFESVSPNVTWVDLFPGRINETMLGMCPEIPMPEPGQYLGLDVVVANLPCGEENKQASNGSRGIEGIRDVHRLQVSLATARLIVENAIRKNKDVYGVFVTKCEPMVELFRCEDLIWHGGEYWVYKPNVDRLREVISMPVGTCSLARPYAGAPGTRLLQPDSYSSTEVQITRTSVTKKTREAYVTVLHSSEDYVCGAIALAQSILRTNTTKELVLLADNAISNHSITGLQAAGWKIKRIERIRSPYADITDYNAWNYSKLRVWQLTEYDKVIFIDSDFIVLRNIDHFFNYPQLSAAINEKWLFNSGIMLLEPSECFFNILMSKRYVLKSYNGGDQGYLNEVLTWWHMLTEKLNFLKFFSEELGPAERLVPTDQYTIHFLGLKPWTCYRDYDCNWDSKFYLSFASDIVHAKWWEVYDAMPQDLQPHCGMTKQLDEKHRERRVWAQKTNLSNYGHWKLELKDPRQYNLVSSVDKDLASNRGL